MNAAARLSLPQRYLEKVRAILSRVVPNYEVWAYGSRVTGEAHDASDLDLVLYDPIEPERPCSALHDLRETFVESDLPIRVDVMDWARIPESFRQEILQAHVVVQSGSRKPAS